jgi:hypothetical protein
LPTLNKEQEALISGTITLLHHKGKENGIGTSRTLKDFVLIEFTEEDKIVPAL